MAAAESSTDELRPIRASIIAALSRLNAEVEEREEERGEKRTVSLQPAWTQEPRKSVRETSGPCINYK